MDFEMEPPIPATPEEEPTPLPIDRDLLEAAWDRVRRGGGSGGIDGLDVKTFEGDLIAQIDALAADCAANAYQPQAYRAVDVPKTDGGYRRLVIACVRDRILQTAAALHLLPMVEPILHPCSYAYRSGLGVHDALHQVVRYRDRGFVHVLRGDIAQFFDRVDHPTLFAQLDVAGIQDPVRGWLQQWLSATVITRHATETITAGLPQGLPISPLLANLYLTPFDRQMIEAGWKIVRYADDFTICCATPEDVARARDEAAAALAALGLTLHPEKTLATSFEEGFVYLGARYQGNDLIPAVAHPYEADFTPPPPPRPRRPERATPPATMRRTLYLQHQGSTLGRHGERLVVTRDHKTLLDLPARHIDQVFIFGRVNITTPAMAFCLERGIPIQLFSGRGRYFGIVRRIADPTFTLRRAQFQQLQDEAHALLFARALVEAKLLNGRTLLAHHHRDHPHEQLEIACTALAEAAERACAAPALEQLRGIEGAAAAAYYRGLIHCFRGPLRFTHRERRPPRDPANSLLSFGYTLLFHNVYSQLVARGLDPGAGLYHQPGGGHPALVSDLMEELRAPIADALVLDAANSGQFADHDFYYAEGNPQPCLLQDEARARYLALFEEKMASTRQHPEVPYPVDWRRIIDLQVQRYRRFVEGSAAAYIPYRTR